MHHTDTVVMVEPCHFSFNAQTAFSNVFQGKEGSNFSLDQVKVEFWQFVRQLEKKGIKVETFKSPLDLTPDAVFPNNWFSTHLSKQIVLFPMMAANRRLERQQVIIDQMKANYGFLETDLTHFENQGQYLEGTGSLILDQNNKVAFACESERTDKKVFDKFCDLMGYKGHWIEIKKSYQPIYHTNVMMSLLHNHVVVCPEIILNHQEILGLLDQYKYKQIKINLNQLQSFAANVMGLEANGKQISVLSTSAYQAFEEDQIRQLKSVSELIVVDIPMIEKIGGGSARCMIAEVFYGS